DRSYGFAQFRSRSRSPLAVAPRRCRELFARMTDAIRIRAAGPGTTIQDDGRPGLLAYGLSASGPMDRGAFAEAADGLETLGSAGIEISAGGLELVLEGETELWIGAAGGRFVATLDGVPLDWPFTAIWKPGQVLRI